MFIFKRNAQPIYHFFMADTADLTQGKTGLSSFTCQHARIGSSLATFTPTITEIGSGWYKFNLESYDGTGMILINISASGAVTWRDRIQATDATPGELTTTMIDQIVASIFREPMTAIEASSYGDTITTTDLSLYKAVMAIVGKVALVNGGTTKRIYKTDESSTALDLTLTSGAAPANPIIAQEP